MSLPEGNVTFLFTDIEGSTRMWEQYPEAMRLALARHDALLRDHIQAHEGFVFKTLGDAFCAAFAGAPQAATAALAIQQALNAQEWGETPIRVRAALHTGWAEGRDGDYFGPTLNRVARLLSIGYGGQTLVSEPAAALLQGDLPEDLSLRDMGHHRLKDLQQPEHVYQLLHADLPAEFPPLRSLNLLRHNLPIQTTTFIGREKPLAEARQLLSRARLLTLTGPGGGGKTRLAVQVAAELLDDDGDGVWLVELAPISDPALVPQTIAAVLNVREEPGRSQTQTLIDHLKPKKMLLVLDTCEHLLTACAQVIDQLLRACPQVKIIATSREALGISGECIYRLPSLEVPNPRRLPPLDVLLHNESMRLFVERAQTHKADFEVTAANARTVVQICAQLDGIPLALELAAARLRAMPLSNLADRLEDRFRILTGGSRTALPRQQTLRAALDWSYDLLTEAERLLMKRLAVFASGWSLEAAEEVCADEQIEAWEVLDLLSSLVDKSLVAYEEHSGQARYSLMTTVRQYCRERLEEGGEGEAALDRHRNYYYRMVAERSEPAEGPEPGTWLERLTTEYDNIRVALDRTLLHNDAAQAAEMCIALTDFWENRGWFREAYDTLQRCLARQEEIESPRTKVQLLTATGWFCQLRADYEKAAAYQQRSLALCWETGDLEGEASALNNLALLAQTQGDTASARTLFTDSLEITRQLGDERKQAARLSNLGLLAIAEGDYPQAREQLEAARQIYARYEDAHGLAASLCNLADMALRQGEGDEAERLLQQCYDLFQALEYQRGLAYTQANLAEAALLRADYACAERRVRETTALCMEMELQELIPLLLEFLAECRAAQGNVAAGRFCLAAAQHLRDQLHTPRSAEEQKRVDAIEGRLAAAPEENDGSLPSERVETLSLSGIIEEAMKLVSV